MLRSTALIFLALTIASATVATAQWTRVDSNPGIPAGLTPAAVTWNGSALFSLHLQTGPSALRMFKSTNAGDSWSEVTAFPGVIPGFDYFGSLDGRLVVAGITNDGSAAYFRISDDDGETWAESMDDDIGGPLHVSRRGDTMFAGTTIGVARSDDDGASWYMTGSGLPTAQFILPTPTTLIAQAGTGTFRSVDDGANWSQVFIPGTINLFHRLWEYDGAIYMKDQVTSNILVSTDEGASWTSYASFSQLDYTSVLVRPGTDMWIPYAVGPGVANFHTSMDLAVTADPIDGNGYPTIVSGEPCFAVASISATAVFVTANLCFNDNNGIYRHDLSADTAVEPREVPTLVRVDAPYPNPATRRVSVPIQLVEPSTVEVRVADALGRTLRRTTATLPVGSHELPIDLAGATSGAYLVSVRAGRTNVSRRVIVID